MTIDRELVLRALAGCSPADGKEAADLRVMRRLARELDAPCWRGQSGAHFTASALVVDAAGARAGLVRHRKLGRWLQPGGHVEPHDDSLAAAAQREAREELGVHVMLHPTAPRPLDVDVHEFPARDGVPPHLHLDVCFLCVALGAELAHDGAEADEAAWLSFDEAAAVAGERRLARLLGKARAVVRRPTEDVGRA